jgi:Uma2 family endonuclease
MSTAVVTEIETVADLLRDLGVDASRIRMHPAPGTATEKDVIEIHDRTNRLCELIDGVLVEKVMGYYEGRLALILGHFLELFVTNHNLGIAVGADGFLRLGLGLVRIPDLSFTRWDRLPNRQIPREPIPELAPNLAVEVLSVSNTRTEMERKRREYFNAGVELVWQIDPDERTCEVFTSPDDSIVIGVDGVVDGGTVLPGFQLPLREFFDRADRGPQQSADVPR